jgi:hypothetical protein
MTAGIAPLFLFQTAIASFKSWLRDLAAGYARVFIGKCPVVLEKRAWGTPGAAAPAASRAK